MGGRVNSGRVTPQSIANRRLCPSLDSMGNKGAGDRPRSGRMRVQSSFWQAIFLHHLHISKS